MTSVEISKLRRNSRQQQQQQPYLGVAKMQDVTEVHWEVGVVNQGRYGA